jgi:hypothetical protein
LDSFLFANPVAKNPIENNSDMAAKSQISTEFNNVAYEIPKLFSRCQRLAIKARGISAPKKNPVNDNLALELLYLALSAAAVGIHFIWTWQLLQRTKVLLRV